jgi:hypothetical protein
MNKRFSAEELFALRSTVNLELLLSELHGESAGQGDVTAIRCPQCRNLSARVVSIANVAYCEQCRKNFNVIDFVMHELGCSFVQSVELLKRYLQGEPAPRRLERRAAPVRPERRLIRATAQR